MRELAFCLPVSTAKLERSFSMLKCIKRDTRAGLGARVENLTRILQEGPLLECFDPTDAMKLLADYVVQRLAQSKCHHNYKKRESKSNNNNNCESSSTDDDDDDDDDDEFEM